MPFLSGLYWASALPFKFKGSYHHLSMCPSEQNSLLHLLLLLLFWFLYCSCSFCSCCSGLRRRTPSPHPRPGRPPRPRNCSWSSLVVVLLLACWRVCVLACRLSVCRCVGVLVCWCVVAAVVVVAVAAVVVILAMMIFMTLVFAVISMSLHRISSLARCWDRPFLGWLGRAPQNCSDNANEFQETGVLHFFGMA